MLRLFSFTIFAFLKLTIVLTQSIHSMILNVCYTIENLLQLNSTFLDNVPESFNIKKLAHTETFNDTGVEGTTVSTQTALANIFPRCINRKNSNPDIIAYNLSSTKLITVEHNSLNKNYSQAISCCHCEKFKPEEERSNVRGTQSDNPSLKAGDTFNITNFNVDQHRKANGSDISIENDTVNSQIILNSPMVFPDYMILKKKLIDKSTQYFSYDYLNDNIIYNFEGHEVQENVENLPPSQTSVKYAKEEIVQHKTSSPIGHRSKLPVADQSVELDIVFHGKQNARGSDEVLTRNLENLGEFRSSDQFNRSSVLESTILLDDVAKRRFSLSPNTKNSAVKAAALKSIQDEILELTRKTPRNEMNAKEIKFPYTSDTSIVFQTMDEKEEAKEIFSCSSYESLPVSDHIRTVFEKSIFSSLYTENFANITEPDFSSVDSFVEAFQKLESKISIGESAKKRISEGYAQSKNSKNKFARNLSVEFLEMDKRQNRHNMRKAVSSCMLNSTSNYQYSHEKGFTPEFAESEYQYYDSNLARVSSVFKSRASSSSSIPDDKNSDPEESKCNYTRENSKCEDENKVDKNIVNNSGNIKAVTDLENLNDNEEICENNSTIAESNGINSNSEQFARIQNIPEHNQENKVSIDKSTQNVDFKYQAKPELYLNENVKLVSNKQKCNGKTARYARKSFTGCKNKVHKTSNAVLSSVSPNRDMNKNLSNRDSKSELLEVYSTPQNSEPSEEQQTSDKIENKENLKIDEIVIHVEKSTNSLDLDDSQGMQSIMNNAIDKENKENLKIDENVIHVEKSTNSLDFDDLQSMESIMNNDIDKYKFTFIEDEILRTPEDKRKDKINP